MPSRLPWYGAETIAERGVELLDGALRDYDWGSPDAIPELLGRPPTGAPVAELWLGAHPSAPARVGSEGRALHLVVAEDPDAALGAAADRFDELPFLFKVLAAAEPLSLQAHPSAAQAEEGFAREEAAGVPRDARERVFRDAHHKPELLCALTPFDALCGFRDPVATLDVLATIDTPALDPVRDRLSSDPSPEGIRSLLGWLLAAPEAAASVEPVIEACRASDRSRARAEREAAVALADRHGPDPGVLVALLLNLVRLEPGEALFLGPGNLHAYLRGVGVEIMSNSDNVVRGGLTTKHVDVPMLLEIVDPTPDRAQIQRPEPEGGVIRYHAPVPEFALSRVDLDGDWTLTSGPAIVWCLEGRATAGERTFERGEALWVPASDGAVILRGRATVFVAEVGR